MPKIFCAVTIAAALLLGGCADDLVVPDYNNPSLEDLRDNPSASTVAAAAAGLLVGGRAEFDDRNGYVSLLGILGRESYNFDGADPRFVTEMLESQLNPSSPAFGGNLWSERYVNIRTGAVLLQALEKEIAGISQQEKELTRGFVKTLRAHELLLLVNTRAGNGIVVDVPADPLADPGPLVAPAQALERISALLDEAAGHLTGGGSFPFPTSSGLAGFDTPAGFLEFNRALKARVEAYRENYTAALQALSESFVDPNASMRLGVYHSFSGGSGDAPNDLFDPGDAPDILAHPSIVADAEAGDARLAAKVRELPSSQTTRGITTKYAFSIYDGLSAPVPIIRNEELVLLRAEARWFTGDKLGAMEDLNAVRARAELAPLGMPATDAGFVDALLHERRYSLLFEGGHRWIDARRFDRLESLPLDLPNHVRNSAFPIPEAECLARDQQVCAAT